MHTEQRLTAALNRFVVSERPMASDRSGAFSPTLVADWIRNEKVRRALECLSDQTKYVEDGDVLYKVRVEAI